jgi:hypothetical protein
VHEAALRGQAEAARAERAAAVEQHSRAAAATVASSGARLT